MSFTSRLSEFFRLPVRFDQARLQRELSQFDRMDWEPHPASAVGDASITMVSIGGTSNHDFAISGQSKSTVFLERCPYLRQALASLENPVSRCRVTRLAGNARMPARKNWNYHWFRHMPVYVPIATDPETRLFCGDGSIHMAAGDAWTFDHTLPHWMVNESSQDCIHLVVEIKRSSAFEKMLTTAGQPYGSHHSPYHVPVREIPYSRDKEAGIELEAYSFEILTPQEIRDLTAYVLSEIKDAPMSSDDLSAVAEMIGDFRDQWESAFSRFGHQATGELTYRYAIVHFEEQIVSRIKKWLPWNGKGKYAIDVICSMLSMSPPAPKRFGKHLLEKKRARDRKRANFQPLTGGPAFDRPLFIVSAPRAGSTLLFNTLSNFPELWSTGDENHESIEDIEGLHPSEHDFGSNRLTEADASPRASGIVRRAFIQELQDRDRRAYLELPAAERPNEIRFLEKTPKNALRIPFFKRVFPGALFIYLYRDPAENISSIVEGWRSRRFIPYRNLPGWPFKEWSFLLIPGWSSLQDCSLVEIAAHQWRAANACIRDDLQRLPASDRCFVNYADLIREPKETIERISRFAGLEWDRRIEQALSGSLPLSERTLSAPSPDKWRKNEKEISAILSRLEPLDDHFGP